MFSYQEILQLLQKYKVGKNIIVEEKAEDGKAELKLDSDNNLFAISLSHKDSIKVFKHQKVADWIILEFLDDTYKKVNLHLIELKRTITDGTWQKIKEQLKGAYEHSFLLKGLFDYEIGNIICYSAYIYDKLVSTNLNNTTNPVLLKATLGNTAKTSSIDWNNDKINFHNLNIFHKKIKLDLDNDIGKGSFRI